MVAVGTRAFAGMMPRIYPELLPDAGAQLAINTRHKSGALEPWKAPGSTLVTLASEDPVLAIYRFGQGSTSETQFWFESTVDANFVKGPVPGDTQERTYWTDGDYPKKTDSTIATTGVPYPSTSYRLAVPPPDEAPVATVSGDPDNEEDPATTSVYVCTYVTGWGEESAPGPASNLVTWRPGQSVNVTLPGAITGEYNIEKVRIYRSNTGTARTEFQFLDEVAVAAADIDDNTPNSELGEVLVTWDWDPPPDELVGLCEFNSEILAGFFGNTLCFCEPGVPYAWPNKYRLAFDAPIVGIAAFGQSLFVGTTRGCHLVTGTDPAALTSEQLRVAQSCVSKRSVVPMLGGVVWASPDGLFFVGPGVVQNLTEKILTREEWQAYAPESISGYEMDGHYIATYNTGTETGSLIFKFGDDASFVKSSVYFTAAYQEKARDALYIVQENAVKKWDAGSALTMTWRSKVWRFPMDVAMNCARVEALNYPVTFRLYANGVQRGSDVAVNSAAPFRLPPGRAHTYEVQVSGTNAVTAVHIATSMKELGGV